MNLSEILMPDGYLPNINAIRYGKLYQNGIKYAIFDVDCTILPYNDINLLPEHIDTFNRIKSTGMNVGLCSSGSEKRVKPIGDGLGAKYIYRARKPFGVKFKTLQSLFGDECHPQNTVFIGDSLYLDMLLAGKNGMHKILIDPIKSNFNVVEYGMFALQGPFSLPLKKNGFALKKTYYHSPLEK